MNTVEEMRAALAPKKRIYCQKLKEPILSCNIKQCEYYGKCSVKRPYNLPALKQVLFINPPRRTSSKQRCDERNKRR